MSDQIEIFFSVFSAESIAVTAAVLATSIGFLTSAFGQILSATANRDRASDFQDEVEALLKDQEVDLKEFDFESHVRLADLRVQRDRFKRQATRNSISYNSLVFGQYVVGALLASSFIQQSLEGAFIGLLGVLVLLSSAIQQRFRPDVLSMQAKFRLTKAKRIIREIEDSVFLIKSRAPKAPSILKVREIASRSLTALEADELTGFEAYIDARTPQNGEG